MSRQMYEKQVNLLLQILPEVAKEKIFALNGGTCINLFIRDMVRLSVDIDLTYIPLEDRNISLSNMLAGLARIEENIKRIIPNAQTDLKNKQVKLIVNAKNVVVKIEVSVMNRGLLGDIKTRILCPKAQETFNAFCEMATVSTGQLYGGKICAALDRQHPRDLFDVKYLLENEGFSEEVKAGFVLMLLSSERPIHEMLNPNMLDQRSAFENQFYGMTTEEFTYEDYERTRFELINAINKQLTAQDKQFLLSFKNLTPEWGIYPYAEYPGVKWKLLNLDKLRTGNPSKYMRLFDKLKETLKV